MATTAAEPVFVYTNALVYAYVAEAPWHQEARDVIVALRPPARRCGSVGRCCANIW